MAWGIPPTGLFPMFGRPAIRHDHILPTWSSVIHADQEDSSNASAANQPEQGFLEEPDSPAAAQPSGQERTVRLSARRHRQGSGIDRGEALQESASIPGSLKG